MRAIEIEAEPCSFEVILYSRRWLFSTFVQGFCAQYALETAEKNLLAHAALHHVDRAESQAETANVIAGADRSFFRRLDGIWWLAQQPAQEVKPRLSGGNGLHRRRAAA